MLSPSPTQPPVPQTPAIPPMQQVPNTPPIEPEKKPVALTPAKKRAGQTRFALFIKAILRPIFKAIYYVLRWIRTHKWVSLLTALLLVTSIFATSYFATGNVPLVESNTAQQEIRNNPQISPDVQAWLLALKAGDINSMLTVQKAMNANTRPPDSGLYVLQFSEPRGQVKWTDVQVTSLRTAPDGLVDTYIEITMNAPASVGGKYLVLWHFSSLPAPDGRIYMIDYVSARAIQ